MKLHARWMIRRDMPEVLRIESDSFASPWPEDDFIHCLRRKNCICMVAVELDIDDQPVVGYMIYELHKSRLELLNLAVAPIHRRRGVGSALVQKLRDKLSHLRRRSLYFDVADTNLSGHLFLRAMGFRAVEVIPERFSFNDDGNFETDAYRFEIRVDQPTAKATT